MEVQQIVRLEMDGKYKIILLILLFLSICNCKNQVKTENSGKELIIQNINFLIDSVERFDMSKIPVSEKFKDIKIEKITVGILDSVLIDNEGNLNKINPLKYSKFKMCPNDLVKFKSEYKIKLVKINNYDSNILFVKFSNLKIENNEATIDVKKNIGISMIKERYYFVRKNNFWLFKKKILTGSG
ncbi:hypothetical protein [Flavobacterium branchiophilum]|uniref:Uncharacterized protein n=1 Tax=Flavobacterium branchiophilum (strain FL-15) TaxID=1034807 RepID=G2Z2N8_FLABF|nr:hypothetical protein [Flavobacterium branchiophilum]CCB70211.1 Hypothetical protein FBFL15_2191 [Flavobacterium branchiophilum FL-15]